MARTTLERLENDKGFFALIEGANIDTYSHSANPCQEIGEAVEFDRAVRLVLDYAKAHPNTLVVVTADHGHAGQIVPVDAETDSLPPGVFSTLVTNEGARMRIAYDTVPAGGLQKHTGTQVRIAAQGPEAGRVLGVTDQTDLFGDDEGRDRRLAPLRRHDLELGGQLLVGADDVHDGVDQREVGERLREVAQVPAAVRVDLLGVEPERAGERQELLAQRAPVTSSPISTSADTSQNEQMREAALLAGEPVVGVLDAVAQHQPVAR